MKNNKGMTIISLMITTVVMLILVAILLLMTVGPNGLFLDEKKMVWQAELKEAADEIDKNVAEAFTSKYLNEENTAIDFEKAVYMGINKSESGDTTESSIENLNNKTMKSDDNVVITIEENLDESQSQKDIIITLSVVINSKVHKKTGTVNLETKTIEWFNAE